MSDIKKATLQRALTMLHAVGAQYCVLYAGESFGELKVDVRTHRKNKNAPAFNNVTTYDYIRLCNAAKPGDVLEFQAETYEQIKSLQGSIGSLAVRTRGPGGFTSMLHQLPDKSGYRLETMCVSPLLAEQAPA